MIARAFSLLSISVALSVLPAQAQLLLSGPNSVNFPATAGSTTPAVQTVVVSHTGAAAKTFTVSVSTASGGNWLTASTAGGTTPTRFTIAANPAGLVGGAYTGTVTIASTGVPSAQVSVTLTIVPASQLSSSPSALSFLRNTNADITTGEQLVFVNASGSPLTYRVTSTTTDNGSWLLASALTTTTPGVVSVRVNPGGLVAGTYNGTVTIAADGANSITVPVSLIISANPFLTTTPTALTFAVTRNGPPSTRQLSIAASGGTVAITAGATTNAGGNWLIVAPVISSASGSVDVSVNPTGLAAGNYTGTVQITAPNAANTSLNVPVSLVVTDLATVSATPASIDATYTVGAANPLVQQQTLQVSASAAGTTINISASTFNGGPWLLAGPAQLTVAAAGQGNPVTIQTDATGLAPGQYRGSITVSGAGNSVTIPVSLQVTNTAALAVDPNTVVFNLQKNQTAPSNQIVNITSTGAAYNYQTAITAISPAAATWLNGAATTGTTPGLLTLSLNTAAAAALANGQYSATITTSGQNGVTPEPPNSPKVNVILNVSDTPLYNVSPSTLDFAVPLGAPAPALRLVTVTATDNSAQAFVASATTTTGGNWLLVGPTNGNTPANISVSVVPTGLPPGLYEGTIAVTVPSISATPQNVRVRLLVQPSVTVAVAPTSLSFSQTRGGATPAPQSLSVTGTGNANFQVTVTTASGGAWLTTTPTGGATPGTIQVSVNGTNLAAGTYNGSIGITSLDANNSPLVIPVTLTVTAASLNVTPTAVNLVAAPGSTQAATQSLSINTGNAFAPFTATASTTTGGNWLSVSPASGNAPASITVSANPTGLGQAVYNGSVSVNVSGIGVVTIPVTFTIAATPTMSANPSTLSFDYSLGSSAPAAQSVAVATSGINLSYIVTFTTTTGGNWLSVTPTSGTTPSSFSVQASPLNLAPGTYTGQITITSSASNNPILLPVTFIVRPGRQLLSQIADGAGWKTSIILVNLDNVAATYNLRFYSGDGSPLRLAFEGSPGRLETLEGSIPVGGSRTIITGGTDTALSQGWAELSSTRLVSGLAVFRQRVQGRPDQEAGVPAIASSGRFVLPFDNTQSFVSSMALVNTNTSNARALAVTPRDEAGTALPATASTCRRAATRPL
ncbi:MAG: hypothetical protein HY820_41885 [Acidobacteria bacterium]|nr:hypothetical protein [Acidobacteriota bacterium]